MRGRLLEAGKPGSAQLFEDLPEPDPAEGAVLVEGLAVGVCGTDREVVACLYGEAPGPDNRLVIGHESLGRVISDSSGTLARGDYVVGVVRRPDPVPCINCA